MTDIQQDKNCSNVATGVYPYWSAEVDGQNVLVELPEKTVSAPGTYNFVKIRTLDLSSEFETQPTVEQLRSKTESYIKNNNIGVPSVSWSVSFEQLSKSEEYKHLALLERVSLFDTVNVEFPALGVSATAKAVKMVYDVLADRVKSVTLGSVRANIADTIASQQQEIQQAPNKSDLQKAKDAATSWLTNGKGYAYFRKDDLGNVVDILFMDTRDAGTAVNVMRVGQSGIGFSHNGVNGPYESAWTIDGKFNADWIAAGTLYGILVKAGTIQSADGKITIDLNSEAGKAIFNSGVSTNSFTLRGDTIGAKDLIYADAVSINGQDTVRILFYTGDGRAVGAMSNLFDGEDQIGLQYRAYNVGAGNERKSGVDIRAGYKNGESESGFFLVDGSNNDAVRGYFKIRGESNQESEIVAHNASFDKFDGKKLFWRIQNDGTYALMGRD